MKNKIQLLLIIGLMIFTVSHGQTKNYFACKYAWPQTSKIVEIQYPGWGGKDIIIAKKPVVVPAETGTVYKWQKHKCTVANIFKAEDTNCDSTTNGCPSEAVKNKVKELFKQKARAEIEAGAVNIEDLVEELWQKAEPFVTYGCLDPDVCAVHGGKEIEKKYKGLLVD